MFTRAYEIANDLGETETIEQSRVQMGIAVAHTVLDGYSECMDNLDKPNMERLLVFKSTRLESFTEEGMEEYLAYVGGTKVDLSSESGSTHGTDDTTANSEKSFKTRSTPGTAKSASSGVTSDSESLFNENVQ